MIKHELSIWARVSAHRRAQALLVSFMYRQTLKSDKTLKMNIKSFYKLKMKPQQYECEGMDCLPRWCDPQVYDNREMSQNCVASGKGGEDVTVSIQRSEVKTPECLCVCVGGSFTLCRLWPCADL